MIYKNINFIKNIILYEKLNNTYKNNKKSVIINKLVVTLKLPSNIKYINGFITMLILLEKNTNNIPIFLRDINTLSKGRFIKIGLVMCLTNELIEQYLQMCLVHSTPKINKDNINFKFTIKNYNVFYNTNVILSNVVFGFDNNIVQYYNYLNEFIYNIEFVFYVNTKNIFINKFLMSLYNLDITVEDENVKYVYNTTIENNAMLEIGDEEFSDIEEENKEGSNSDKCEISNNMLEYVLDYK